MRKSDKIFLIPIILLGINFLYRLFNATKLLTTFPLDITNDYSAYLSLVHFFDHYGFLQTISQWYNGFVLFGTYPPGWVFFTYPLYKLFGNLLVGSFVSMLILYGAGFIAMLLIGKELKLSQWKRLALFLFIFANPMLIGAILKQGRIPSLMGLVLFLFLIYIALYFKNRQLSWKIIFLSLTYGALILTHQAETILATIFLLGLILAKNWKERIILIIAMLFGIFLSSFWLIPFIRATLTTQFLNIDFSKWLLDFHSYLWNNLVGIFAALGVIGTFVFFYNQQKEKKTLLFFAPVIILAILFLTRLVLVFPVIKYLYLDPYIDFFVIFLSIFLVSLDYKRLPRTIYKALPIFLVLIAIVSVAYNIERTPFVQEWTPMEEEFVSLLPSINDNGKFIMITQYTETSYSRAYYAYAAIYNNKSSISGWGDMYKEFSYTDKLNTVYRQYLKTEECTTLFRLKDEFNATDILADKYYCSIMTEKCGLEVKETREHSCLLKF